MLTTMSKWMQFNCIIFGIILFIFILLKIGGYYQQPLALPSFVPTITPESSAAPTDSPATPEASAAAVLGATTGEQMAATPAPLIEYDNTTLKFAVFLPEEWQLRGNQLVTGGIPICQFNALTVQPAGDLIIEKSSLAEKDLPQIAVIRYRLEDQHDQIRTRYIFKDEEDTEKLELECPVMQEQSPVFFQILNSVRFL
ncbi:hypothetical protein KA082_00510 [Candidatus Woesebacteria bacterium]|nr:hypothetical protein [Candidatus Woesebacteria bacterium]